MAHGPAGGSVGGGESTRKLSHRRFHCGLLALGTSLQSPRTWLSTKEMLNKHLVKERREEGREGAPPVGITLTGSYAKSIPQSSNMTRLSSIALSLEVTLLNYSFVAPGFSCPSSCLFSRASCDCSTSGTAPKAGCGSHCLITEVSASHFLSLQCTE